MDSGELVRDLTLNLLYLATGVFAIAGAYLVQRLDHLKAKNWLRRSLLGFGASVILGSIVLMRLINLVGNKEPVLQDLAIQMLSTAHFLLVILSAGLFMVFIHKNIQG